MATEHRTAHIKTFGCQMNVYDSERMAEVLADAGYRLSDRADDADLVLLNTCHIREKASDKVYSEVGRVRAEAVARNTRPPTVVVAGCVAQAEGAELLRRAPGVGLVVGPQSYHRLPHLLGEMDAQAALGKRPRLVDTEFPADDKFDHLPNARTVRGPAAFVTVQEGCDKFCTFCVVPYTRGAEVSRPAQAIIDEVRQLVDKGVVDLTLLGQNVNAYHGEHTHGPLSLAGLITALAEIPGLKRIRYTTSHPRDMAEDLISAHRDIPKLMPFLHLPVQSGSDRILAAMNRKHTAASYLTLVDRLRAARPDLALSGDFIVGFPGETDADFAATLDLVRTVDYAQAYSFKYSPRPGTPAAESAEQVPEAVKAARLAQLQDLLFAQQARFNAGFLGQTFELLLERAGRQPGQFIGRSPYMQSVHITAPGATLGEMLPVRIISTGPHSLEGALVQKAEAA